jgi:hypothetical protein
MMPRKVELSRTLTIRGEETDCLVHCEVSLFDDETGRGGEVDITKVEVDGGDDTEIPQADWPEGLLKQVEEKACEAAAEQDADDYDDFHEPHADDDFGDDR